MSWNLIITDGLEQSGVLALQQNGFKVDLRTVDAAELAAVLQSYQGIIVRSATKLRADVIQQCPGLKFIARAGVGLDNIDLEAAQKMGIKVINTPASSSRSVAELSMAHLFNLSRGLKLSNRTLKDKASFISLKKSLANSSELKGKTLFIIGMGRIGRELALMAVGIGMKVIANDPFIQQVQLNFELQGQSIPIPITLYEMEEGLRKADFISIHSPFSGHQILTKSRIEMLKKTACIINTSRGENIDESALLEALDLGLIGGAGLDVFQNEPEVNPRILNHPKISLSPHIGASTQDAQMRIAEELVEQIIQLYKNQIS